MNLIQKILLFCSLITISFISCKKTAIFDEQGNLLANSEFSISNIKTWYNQTFLNSTEGKLSSSEKKYPLWKNGIYYKWSNYEVFEFPLKKNKIQIDVPSKLSTGDKKKLAAGSLTRIRFIKDKDGNIYVVEVNYIPDYEYLKKYNYDISNTAFGKENSDFTGSMILKKWNGGLMSKYILSNGKIIGEVHKKNETAVAKIEGQNSNFIEIDCPTGTTEMCTIGQYCEVYTDGMIGDCNDWELEPGSCYCEGTPNPTEDPCEGLSPAQCDCQQLGACGSGGGEPETPEEPPVPVSKEDDFIIYEKVTAQEHWNISIPLSISGLKYENNPSNNSFTSVAKNLASGSYSFNYIGATGIHSNPSQNSYCFVNTTNITFTHTFGTGNKTFSGSGQMFVTYPNHSPPETLGYPNYKTWSAQNVFN